MKLNLAIIHLDMVIDTLELAPGEYSIGRSRENNIVVQHFSLNPEQGRLFFDEEKQAWFYQEVNDRPRRISDDRILRLSDQISIATQEFVDTGALPLNDMQQARGQHQAKRTRRLGIVLSVILALIMISGGGYYAFQSRSSGVQASRLINRVRDKIVEFESVRDDKALAELQQYAGLKEQDFKESSGFCTGFLVGPNVVLTAAHCLMGRMVIDLNNDFYLKTADGKSHQIEKVLGFDVKRDFLFLKTKDMESYGHLEFAPGYEIEQKVFTVGNVHGEGIAIRDGIISSVSADQDEPDVKFLRYSAGTSPGNSGGPLLNKYGEVVALVFASTYSENFNLGTPTQDLRKAYQRFVENEEEGQTIELALKRVLNFKPSLMLQSLSLPFLPQFSDYPEITKAFSDLTIEVNVPVNFDEVDKAILDPINKKAISTFFEVQKILREKNEIVLDWKSFVSDKSKAILPSQFDLSQSMFEKIGGRYFPMVAGLIDSPSKEDYKKYLLQFDKENKFDFQAYGYNIEIQQEKKIDLLKTDVFYKPKDVSGNKMRLQDLSYGAPYSQLLIYGDSDLRTRGFFDLKLFMKNFLGESGILASSVSRFVRPLAGKDFTLKTLEIPNERIGTKEVKDAKGRPWRRSRLRIFEDINIFTYCTDLPEGTFCIGRVFNIHNKHLLAIIENNFRKFILSHLLINPYFWSLEPLLGFIKSGQAKLYPLMAGVDLKLAGNKLQGSLSRFPFRFELPDADKMQSVRLQTGLFGDSKKANWTGYGIEWVQMGEEKDLLCGLGLEPFKSQSAFILNYLRDRRKQEKLRKIKGEDPKPLPGIWYRPFRGVKKPFQIYGFCAPLEADPRVNGQYFVDFKNAKPLKYKYSISR